MVSKAVRSRSRIIDLALVSVLLTGCGRTDTWLLPASGTQDASVAMPADAGMDPDAGFPDSGPADSGAPAPNSTLADALTCGLDQDEALRAATRIAACARGLVSISGVMETYDAFMWGGVTPGFTRLPTSCGFWRCAAEVDRCDDLGECFEDIALSANPCRGVEWACQGDVLGTCVEPYLLPHMDCGALGATCEDGACIKDGCRFGSGQGSLRCGEDGSPSLTMCGEYEVNCEAWGSQGSTCANFYVQGEVPVPWCAPEGVGSVAGSYDTPVACRRGVVEFEVVGGREYRIDCRSMGYRGCDEYGCIE